MTGVLYGPVTSRARHGHPYPHRRGPGRDVLRYRRERTARSSPNASSEKRSSRIARPGGDRRRSSASTSTSKRVNAEEDPTAGPTISGEPSTGCCSVCAPTDIDLLYQHRVDPQCAHRGRGRHREGPDRPGQGRTLRACPNQDRRQFAAHMRSQPLTAIQNEYSMLWRGPENSDPAAVPGTGHRFRSLGTLWVWDSPPARSRRTRVSPRVTSGPPYPATARKI